MAVRFRSASAPAWQFSENKGYKNYSLEKLKKLEKGFILDGVPLSKLANDEVGRTNPTLNLGIAQYIATNDLHCQLDCTCGSSLANDSMMGSVNDKFLSVSAAKVYIENRKNVGAGYTRKLYGGHLSLPTNEPKPGYHGEGGYRRNTPDLRSKPSPFDCEVKPALFAPGNIQDFRNFRMKSAFRAPMVGIKKATPSTV